MQDPIIVMVMMIMIIIMIIIIVIVIIIIIIIIMKHNKALRTLERLRICWDIESTHVEINNLLLSVICFCVFC